MGQLDSSGLAWALEKVDADWRMSDLRSVWFVGFGDYLGPESLMPLRALDISPVMLRSFSDLRLATARSVDRLIVAVINVDAFGDLGKWFDTMMTLRNDIPDLTIVLVSQNFKQDDLTRERLPVCDASLTAGATGTRIVEAINIAIANNSEWQRRAMAAQRIRLAAAFDQQHLENIRLSKGNTMPGQTDIAQGAGV